MGLKIIKTLEGDNGGSFSADLLIDKIGDCFVKTQALTRPAIWQDYIDFNIMPPKRLSVLSQYNKTVQAIHFKTSCMQTLLTS